MKKLMFWMPLAAIALASCSNDEQVSQVTRSDVQELTIRPIVGNATRSVTSDANFTTFYLEADITSTGGEKFWSQNTDNSAPTSQTHDGTETSSLRYDVTKNTTNNRWETMDSKSWYWSSKNASASFKAIYPKAAKDDPIVIANSVTNQNDIIVAYNEGTASSFTNGVPLLFRHVLSQIVIKADNKDADIRQIKVAGVRLHNIANTNSLTLPSAKTTAEDFKWYDETTAPAGYKPWAAAANNKEKYTYYKKELTGGSVASDGFITLNAGSQDITFDGALLLFPQNNGAAESLTDEDADGKTYFDILVQVQNLESTATTVSDKAIFPKMTAGNIADQPYAWVAVPVAIDWKPGYKYTYVLHFSKDGIGKTSPDTGEGGTDNPGTPPGSEIVDNPVPLYFTVTIDEWNDASTSPEEKDL